MSPVIQYELKNNIAVISVNNPPVNTLSQAVRQGIADSIDRLNHDPVARAGIIICVGRTFIAGADISEFNKPPLDPSLPEVISKIEASNKIIIAALHGTALGGGFETAMACHYRCAVSEAKVGLPEVKLGLLAGASGTQRLPRLIGAEAAIQWMVSGDHIEVADAFKLGAIDRILTGDLLNGALEFANELLTADATPVRLSEKEMLMDSASVKLIADYRKKIDNQWSGYFAPQKIIDCVEACLSMPYDEAVKLERKLFNQCKASSHSNALRRLFFSERQVGKVPGLSRDTPVREINAVAVVGAGTMGSAIAVSFLNSGYSVYLIDQDETNLDKGISNIKKIYQSEVDKGRLSDEQLNERLSRLTTSLELSHIHKVDLVIESIIEDFDIKYNLIQELQTIVNPNTIIASNTSTLDINRLIDNTRYPENIIGMHFFAPAHQMKLLEIVRSNKTDKDVLATIMGLAKKLRKIGVVVNSGFGFAGNRIFLTYLREAQLMLLQGSSPSDIDKVACEWGFPMGPFSVMDLSGLDVFHSIYEQLKNVPGKYCYYPVSNVLFESGHLGRKTQSGFYQYQDSSKQENSQVIEISRQMADKYGIEQRRLGGEEIIERLIYAMINEGVYVLQEKIVSNPGDIDVIMTNGYGFPRYRGGPMCYADIIGLEKVYQCICEYDKQYPDNIWSPSGLLREMIDKGESFYKN